MQQEDSIETIDLNKSTNDHEGEAGAISSRDKSVADNHGASVSVPWYKFDNFPMAQGYNTLGIGRGALVMSNIFLATSLIFLASKDAGCLNEAGDEVVDDCSEKVYGFKPSSLVSNIAVISGVLSALFMPIAGAMVDCTSYRREVGIAMAALMIFMQIIQIGTNSNTWFAMAVLQAFSGFVYQVEVLATYAYLPEVATAVGEARMTRHTATFVMSQFASQAAFLIVVIAISMALGLNNVKTAQLSQGIDALWSGVGFALGWQLLPKVPPRRVLPEGHSLLTEGFKEVFKTASKINKNYRRGLRYYFLALVFAESAASAFTTLSVIYLDDQIGLSGTEIGIFFFTTLIFSLPGSKLGAIITARLDPKRSWQLCMVCLPLYASAGVIILQYVPSVLVFVWGMGVGLLLGWFYPTEKLFFSMCLPKGQEAELSGFFVYCTQILGWLPALLFTALVEADVSKTYGVVAITSFFLIAVGILCFAAPWDEILKESDRSPDGNRDDVSKERELTDSTDASKVPF